MRIRTGIVSVEAHQFLNNKKFEGATPILTCTGGGPFGQRLELVPEGLEVFGATTNAVRHPKGHLLEVNDTDWVLVAPSGNVIVVDNEEFKSEYLDFLGVVEDLTKMVSDPI